MSDAPNEARSPVPFVKRSKHGRKALEDLQRVEKQEEQGEQGESESKSLSSSSSSEQPKPNKQAKRQWRVAKKQAQEQEEIQKIVSEKKERDEQKQKNNILSSHTLSALVASPEKLSPYLERPNSLTLTIKKGFVPNMLTDGTVFANETILETLIEELKDHANGNSVGGFLPSLKQVANVACLPGILGNSLAMPDIHSGYGFSIGGVCATDFEEGFVSPGGVGFDINCGVRLLRTNLTEEDLRGKDLSKNKTLSRLADALFDTVPVGVGSGGSFNLNLKELEQVLERGLEFLLERKMAWPEDLECTEEKGRFTMADPKFVSNRAKQRGLQQVGSLGAGNHYCEVQVIDEIFDEEAAKVMNLKKGQVVIMIHSGSRGLGHQVCTDYLQTIDKYAQQQKQADNPVLKINDRQLAAVPTQSKEGQSYLAAMACAANFAFCNRQIMTYLVRQAFCEVFGTKDARELDMFLVYDVAHNIAKIEEHTVKSEQKSGSDDEKAITKKVLVHRKGATRSFPPRHPCLPSVYQSIGQPVIIGGSMGTCSYVLVGTEKAMELSFGTTCHGAGRALSRNASIRSLDKKTILSALKEKGIELRVSNKDLIAEEAPESYKDVTAVVDTCHDVGISKKVAKMRPVAVIKG